MPRALSRNLYLAGLAVVIAASILLIIAFTTGGTQVPATVTQNGVTTQQTVSINSGVLIASIILYIIGGTDFHHCLDWRTGEACSIGSMGLVYTDAGLLRNYHARLHFRGADNATGSDANASQSAQ